jgi:hypothetical protein
MNQENGLLFMLIRGTSIVDGGQYSFSPLLCQWNRFFLLSPNLSQIVWKRNGMTRIFY